VSDDAHDDEVPLMWREFSQQIDKRLDALRPKRASMKERDWREPVYGWARNHIPDESNLIRRFAEKEVDRREEQATKRGNRELRRWMDGQMPLVWADIGSLPVKVNNELRVRLDAVTPQDLEDAAKLVQDEGLKVYAETLRLAECERDLARLAREAGLLVVALLGDLAPRIEQQAA
jgi:hypothetical protein